MFDELNATFPDHTHFYEVAGLTLAEAMDRAARLTGDACHVLNYQGKIIFAVQHSLDVTGIDWLIDVPGAPVAEVAPVEEIAPVEETAPASSTTKSK